MNDHAIEQVAVWLSTAKSALAFTGAGISTESGIPDFRSPGGVWATNRPVYYQEFLESHAARHEYWRQKAIAHQDFAAGAPNRGHQLLAKWERAGRLQAVITQNIDGLHQAAGSRRVIELHGTAREVACLACEARFPADPYVRKFLDDDRPPDCPACAGILKHATISFGQALDPVVWEEADRRCQRADLILALGSSLVVEPAASLPREAKACGARLVIINRESTPLDRLADVVLLGALGDVLSLIDRALGQKGGLAEGPPTTSG